MSRRGATRFASTLLCATLLVAAARADNPALLDAVKKGDVAAVRSLLASGADANTAQGDGLSVLHLAAQQGNVEIAQLLIARGANLEAKTRIGGYTPLHLASMSAQEAVVRALLSAKANPIAITTNTGVTPLHLAAKALGGEGAVQALLENGAPVDAPEFSAGQTALMFAASAGRTGSVRALLAAKADPSITTEVVDVLASMKIDTEAQERLRGAITEVRQSTPGATGRALTPSEEQKAIAAQHEFLRSKAELEKIVAGFTPDPGREQPSWNTPSGFKSDVLIKVRPQRETLVRKTGGMTALLFAARDGQIEAAEALLDAGAYIDQVSGDGSSPLVIALLNGQFDLAMRLIERGADVNLASTTDGVSPLFAVLQTQWAFKYGDHPQPHVHESQKTEYMAILNALLDKGADPNVALRTHIWYSEYFDGKLGLDITGATPFWRASIAQDLRAMTALAEHGANANTPTTMPDPGLRYGRQNDGRLQEDSGLPILPEGTPNMYPIHAAAGGGYLGLGAFMMNNVPNSFLPAVKFLVEQQGANPSQPDGWGYTPLHYAAVRGDNALIEYLVSKGADVKAVSRLGQSTVDMARGGRAGYFDRAVYPETVKLLEGLGAPFLCLHTHFRGTGDYCPGSGVPPFETMTAPGARPIP
jgi:ankyrin repeat protein